MLFIVYECSLNFVSVRFMTLFAQRSKMVCGLCTCIEQWICKFDHPGMSAL